MSVEKYVVDGKVAVLVSGGFGAGWSTWNDDKGLLFDKEVVEILLNESISEEEREHKVYSLCEVKYPDAYLGGVTGLDVKWVSEGTRFVINENDGSESLECLDSMNFHIA